MRNFNALLHLRQQQQQQQQYDDNDNDNDSEECMIHRTNSSHFCMEDIDNMSILSDDNENSDIENDNKNDNKNNNHHSHNNNNNNNNLNSHLLMTMSVDSNDSTNNDNFKDNYYWLHHNSTVTTHDFNSHHTFHHQTHASHYNPNITNINVYNHSHSNNNNSNSHNNSLKQNSNYFPKTYYEMNPFLSPKAHNTNQQTMLEIPQIVSISHFVDLHNSTVASKGKLSQ